MSLFQKAEPAAAFAAQSDVLGAELAHKLALQEQQANEGIPEVQRLSATFQRGSPLFAKAQVGVRSLPGFLSTSVFILGLVHSRIAGVVGVGPLFVVFHPSVPIVPVYHRVHATFSSFLAVVLVTPC